jgi:predicted lysophospholipase L1 biosynthesis ABC-type transport system permease subunit
MQWACHNPSMVMFVAAMACAIALDAAPDVLVSRQLAARAHLTVGETVTLAADADGARARTFRVAGIYEPTPDPMRFTAQRIEGRMHLPDLIALTADPHDPASAESVNTINVALAPGIDARRFIADLASLAPGVSGAPTARSRGDDPFAVLDRFHLAISAVTVVGSTAFLLALMVIRAEERRDTIAILRMVGISRRSLLTSVAVEGLVIAIAGAIFGVALAFATEGLVNRIFQTRYDTALVFVRVTPALAWRAVAVAAPLGIAAGLAASWTLLRRNILSLFRR